MKKLFLIAAVMATIGWATTNNVGACTLHLPTFELMGFPISPHQVALLGAGHVEERSNTPALILAGMPASPHQVSVLKPRLKIAKMVQASADPDLITIGLTPRSPASAAAAAQTMCAPY